MGLRFSAYEEQVFLAEYPERGPIGVHDILPHRSLGYLALKAHRMGLKTKVPRGRKSRYADGHVIAVLEQCRYLYDDAAAKLGIGLSTVYAVHKRWLAERNRT